MTLVAKLNKMNLDRHEHYRRSAAIAHVKAVLDAAARTPMPVLLPMFFKNKVAKNEYHDCDDQVTVVMPSAIENDATRVGDHSDPLQNTPKTNDKANEYDDQGSMSVKLTEKLLENEMGGPKPVLRDSAVFIEPEVPQIKN